MADPELHLVREAKVADLLGASAPERLEASGVLATGGLFYVVFDSSADLALLDPGLAPGDERHRVVKLVGGHGREYEDLAYDPLADRLFVLIEALPHKDGFLARVEEYAPDFRCVAARWLDFPLERPNKGIEGLTCVRRGGETYLLGLCEGNRGEAGAAGRRPGGGRIEVFGAGAERWRRVATIRLPHRLRFVDYSSLAVSGDRIAVVSQESSALWVGRLDSSAWEIADDGATYLFPRDDTGRIAYCTIEGVSWVAPDRVVVVSDRARVHGPHARCKAEDESIHVFAIPEPM